MAIKQQTKHDPNGKENLQKPMAELFYKTKQYQTDYTTFGGTIDMEDFHTNAPNKKRIDHQMDAMKQSMQGKENEKYKHMTLEELKELKLISNTNGRPSSTLTDETWQKEFAIRKLFITPYKQGTKRLKTKGSTEYGNWNEETKGTYHGRTNWQEYCAYINDVLKNIRSGQRDFCYFIYQIEELLKFHFDTLKTKYCDGYWEVWLEK